MLGTASPLHFKEKWLNKQLRKIIYFSNKSNLFLLRETEQNYSMLPEKDQSQTELVRSLALFGTQYCHRELLLQLLIKQNFTEHPRSDLLLFTVHYHESL